MQWHSVLDGGGSDATATLSYVRPVLPFDLEVLILELQDALVEHLHPYCRVCSASLQNEDQHLKIFDNLYSPILSR